MHCVTIVEATGKTFSHSAGQVGQEYRELLGRRSEGEITFLYEEVVLIPSEQEVLVT